MSSNKVLAVFDIGKTNKKLLLFDENLEVVFQQEEKFKTTIDKDGDECDDIDLIEKWINFSLSSIIDDDKFNLVAVNFSTYGASLAFLDKEENRLTPIYNYLKEIPSDIKEKLFSANGGVEEFCRKTASPELGLLLNSGIQLLWLKESKPAVFKKVSHVLHFPQYLSYIISNKITSEATSIGCHTFLWDFDNNDYHSWISENNIKLPLPENNNRLYDTTINDCQFKCGIGIHDSSASLVPYLKGGEEDFLLVSTGTWAINMNPFNNKPLSLEQLNNDCLCFMDIEQNPVKSSRFFLGHIHDVNTKRLTDYFGVPDNHFKTIKLDASLISSYIKSGFSEKVFFTNGIPENYIEDDLDLSQFKDFSEAYNCFMFDLTIQNIKSIKHIISSEDTNKHIYVTGGFSRNEIFVTILANYFDDKKVFTSKIDNASALGAAIVIREALNREFPKIDLGLKECLSLPLD